MRKCPYCAEEIQDEARVCRHCGRDLTKDPPEVIEQRRAELATQLVGLQKNLAGWHRSLSENAQLAQQAGRQVTWALVGLIIGIFLVPAFGLGLILVAAGILAAVTQSGKRRSAEVAQTEARYNIQLIESRIAELTAQVAALG